MFKAVSIGVLLSSAVFLQGCSCDEGESVSECVIDEDPSSTAEVFYFNQITDDGGNDEDEITTELFAGTESDALVEERAYSTSGDVDGVDVDLDELDDDDMADVAFTVRRTEDSFEFISNEVAELEEGADYTLVAMGDIDETTSLRLAVLEREEQSTASDEVSVRFVHTLSDLDASSLRLDVLDGDGDELVEDLNYASESDYVTLTPSAGRITVDLRDNDDDIVASAGCDVTTGRSYEAILAYVDFDARNEDDIRLFCHEV